MKNYYLSLLILMISLPVFAADKKEKRKLLYFNNTYGHIHELPNKFSPSLTTISCGHPLVYIKDKEDKVGKLWVHIEASGVKGYVDSKHLVKTRPQCPQRLYPKFWNSLEMDVSELYYWGRLYDQYIEGNTNLR